MALTEQTIWLKEGEHNIKYFHYVASKRRKVNSIGRLFSEDGIELTDATLDAHIIDFYKQLFTFKTSAVLSDSLDFVPSRVTIYE